MKLQKDDQYIDNVQFNVVIPKDLREDFRRLVISEEYHNANRLSF